MIRIYEAFEYLDLNQVIEYLQLLGGLDIKEDMLIQLINQQKMPCYVDLNDYEGLLDAVEGANGTEKVIGVGMSRLHAAAIGQHSSQSGFTLQGVFEGQVRLIDLVIETSVRYWVPTLFESLPLIMDASYRLDGNLDEELYSSGLCNVTRRNYLFSLKDLYIKPEDVKDFFVSLRPIDPVANGQEQGPSRSALLMIAYLRDQLCNPNSRNKATDQTALAYGLEEEHGVSTSTSQKLFASASRTAKDNK